MKNKTKKHTKQAIENHLCRLEMSVDEQKLLVSNLGFHNGQVSGHKSAFEFDDLKAVSVNDGSLEQNGGKVVVSSGFFVATVTEQVP